MMKTAVEIINKDYVLGEQMEIPNTELFAVRRESYTEVFDVSGEQMVVLPSQWSLFDIEIWCSGYQVGYRKGARRGELQGRDNARNAVFGALGIVPDAKAYKVRRNR